ncbi:hypothetical protein GALMADRAFT_484751 [Galerina marginata CBS 339.88]|uniref:Sld7 C-terminal domain-containing protein n=1 Tax=Galerina marginata (strain CBS 339.88) TaxID=685588 RepID=A0A067SZP5_GALM3|nr:hypothetical protein GALMADRAFT_484751 [Galerina marginata CBS 339.88]
MSATVLESSGTTNMAYMSTVPITAPTPPRQGNVTEPQTTKTPTSHGTGISNVLPSYRLLYRGALSLPDSLLLLDGLTFAARLDSPSKQSTFHLLENPLALALESMRGRPTLRFMGNVNLRDIYMDESGGVEMDIHPSAVLSQIYFENLFCLMPFSAASTSKDVRAERSEIGIKVALGDSNGPETTEIVVFAQVVPSSEDRRTIRLCVGRITQRPAMPSVQKRGPRPDDPIPRKPPAFFIRDLKRTGSLGGGVAGRELKRMASSGNLGVVALKKQKLPNGNGILADLGSGVRLGAVDPEGDRVFKVPELPKQKANGKGKEGEKDVFGDVSEVQRAQVAAAKSVKGKQKADDDLDEGALEKAIKRATIEYLGRTKDPTNASKVIDKAHSEFKDLYGFIYRGVGFALRAKMRRCTVDSGLINRLIDMHALMYLGGHGGSADVLARP